MTVGFQTTPLPRDPNARAIQGVFRTIADGNQTVSSGTPTALKSSSTECKRLDVTADAANADVVVVGSSTVVGAVSGRRGVVLQPSATYTFYPTDVADVYIDGPHTGDKVSFVYFD